MPSHGLAPTPFPFPFPFPFPEPAPEPEAPASGGRVPLSTLERRWGETDFVFVGVGGLTSSRSPWPCPWWESDEGGT